MGLYIKGMEIPESCYECHLKMNCDHCEGWECFCVPLHQRIGYFDDLLTDKRRDDCPLVPVPPHGRCIDADALAHDLDFDVENDQRALDEMNLVGKEREHLQFDKDCKQNCMWCLSEAQTILEADEGET